MSWATRIAAERTTHAPLAARLVGESFELAFKVLHALSQGPERELKVGHNLGELIRHMGPLERLLRNLWGGDLDYVIDILDGECSPSQVRYGAGGGKSNKRNRIVPSGYAETSGVWTSTTLTLYEELMSSLGQAIWSNYPEGDRNGRPVVRRLEMVPAKAGPEGPRPFGAEEETALQKEMMDPTIWALILKAVNTDPAAPEVPYWGIIPLQRLTHPAHTSFYVRARVSASMVADVEVTKTNDGSSVCSCRIGGRETGSYRLAIHSALAVLPNRGAGIVRTQILRPFARRRPPSLALAAIRATPSGRALG